MARQLRIEFKGAYYHITSFGNDRRDIFRDDDDRVMFLETLGNMSDRFDLEIYAYVLMDNHYHLLLKTRKPNLSKSMQWFGTTYTRRYNITHNRCGHLFQGRFKNFLVENEEYLVRLSCYIHRNPVRAGITRRLVDHPWSSYPVYAYGKESPGWLCTGPIYSLFGTRGKHKAYREMVKSNSREENRIWEDFRNGIVLGSQKFANRIKSKYLSGGKDVGIPQRRKTLRKSNPEAILRKAAKALKCDLEDLIQASRISGADKHDRDMLIYILWSTGMYSNQEIGDLFDLGYSSISRRVGIMEAIMSKDEKTKRRFASIKAQIKV
ncbi:MAG: addiction module toxin RelE [Planctomycetes bacterium]|nr:addiction module toxin RelE [Planctomycetota bacterium]